MKRVIVVDDDEDSRDALSDILEFKGIEVVAKAIDGYGSIPKTCLNKFQVSSAINHEIKETAKNKRDFFEISSILSVLVSAHIDKIMSTPGIMVYMGNEI